MKRLRPLLLLLLSAPIIAGTQARPASKAIVFTHVTVIDATGAPARPDMSVVIRDGRITAVGRTGKVRMPSNARVIEGRGKFLIPGLWDMHAHVSQKQFLTLFIATGVTGLRDMGSTPEEYEQFSQWLKDIEEGRLPGPRVFTAGIVVDGAKKIGRPNSINVESAEEGRQAVRSLKRRGADFVKVYSMLSREAYLAIADEAKREGIAFAGHLPFQVSAIEGSDAGQKSMEHLFGILAACSNEEARLKGEAMSAIEKSGINGFVLAEIMSQIKALDTYDKERAEALFARFVKNGTWHVPTLAGWSKVAASRDTRLADDAHLKYASMEKRRAWEAQRKGLAEQFPESYFADSERLYKKQLELVGAMHRAGVGILAGTDTSALYLTPGFSLHEELVQLVRAGLTPLEALQAATRNPAKYFGRLDSLGTIERGKIADLVLLEADPLKDISNTQKIAAVVKEGRLIAKPELQSMLAAVAAEADRAPVENPGSAKD